MISNYAVLSKYLYICSAPRVLSRAQTAALKFVPHFFRRCSGSAAGTRIVAYVIRLRFGHEIT